MKKKVGKLKKNKIKVIDKIGILLFIVPSLMSKLSPFSFFLFSTKKNEKSSKM